AARADGSPASISASTQKTPAGKYSSTSCTGSSKSVPGASASNEVANRESGPPFASGSGSPPNSGATDSASSTHRYEPAKTYAGIPTNERRPIDRSSERPSPAVNTAPANAPSVFVRRSSGLAVRTGEVSWAASTRRLSAAPVAVAPRIARPAAPPAVTSQTAPQPAKSTTFRTASTASRAPSDGSS